MLKQGGTSAANLVDSHTLVISLRANFLSVCPKRY
jgi:hypothetical protein